VSQMQMRARCPTWIFTSWQLDATVDGGSGSAGGRPGGLEGFPGGVPPCPGGVPPCPGGVRPGFPLLFPRPVVGCGFLGLCGVAAPGCGDGVTAGGVGVADGGGVVVGGRDGVGLPDGATAGEWDGGAPMTAGGEGCRSEPATVTAASATMALPATTPVAASGCRIFLSAQTMPPAAMGMRTSGPG
jgi:hypothetical protein